MRLCLILIFCFPLLAQAQSKLADSKAELQQLKQKIASIARQLEADESSKSSLSKDIQRIEKRLTALREAARVAKLDVDHAQIRLDGIEGQRKQLQAEMQTHYQGLSSQVRATYVIGRQAQTRMLLSQQNPARLARMQTYMAYLQRHYQQRIESFSATLDKLEIKTRESTLALGELKKLQTSREQALAAIETQHKARQSKLKQVQQRLGKGGSELKSLTQQQVALEKLIEQLTTVVSANRLPPLSGPFARLKGQLYRPVPGATLARYNSKKPDGETRWKGLWLAADSNSPVHAIAAGYVVYVGWMHHYGLLVVLDHGAGWFSLYGHNESVSHTVGDRVRPGDVIAAAGNTGGHEKSGVYLEIRNGRKTHNPSHWLRAAKR